MQALFIFSLFAFVLTLMSAIIAGGTTSSEMLRKERIKETERFFEAVAVVVKNDITQKYLTANPKGSKTPAAYVNGLPEIAAMSSGLYGTAGMDAWGRPLQGAIVTQNLLLTAAGDPDSLVRAPVTAVAFVSGGPDGIVQTAIPAAPTTIGQVRNIVVPTNAKGQPTSDDIVYTFDNREDQMRALQTMHAHMERIGTAALKKYQFQTTQYRDTKIKDYEKDIAAGKAVSPPDMDLSKYADAPRLVSLTTAASRYSLGIDEDIKILERKLPDGKQGMVLNAANPANANAPLLLTITNPTAANSQTPWMGTDNNKANFKYVVRIYPDKI